MSDHNVGTALSGRSQQGMQIRSPVLERGGLIYQVAAARREVLFTITSHDKSPWTIVGAYPVGFGDRGQHRPFAPSVFLHRSSTSMPSGTGPQIEFRWQASRLLSPVAPGQRAASPATFPMLVWPRTRTARHRVTHHTITRVYTGTTPTLSITHKASTTNQSTQAASSLGANSSNRPSTQQLIDKSKLIIDNYIYTRRWLWEERIYGLGSTPSGNSIASSRAGSGFYARVCSTRPTR